MAWRAERLLGSRRGTGAREGPTSSDPEQSRQSDFWVGQRRGGRRVRTSQSPRTVARKNGPSKRTMEEEGRHKTRGHDMHIDRYPRRPDPVKALADASTLFRPELPARARLHGGSCDDQKPGRKIIACWARSHPHHLREASAHGWRSQSGHWLGSGERDTGGERLDSAFQGDTTITSIAVPCGFTAMESRAFAGCTALASSSCPPARRASVTLPLVL